MKRTTYIPILAAMLGLGAFVACSDEWDRHYDPSGKDSAADAPTLWQQVCAKSELAEFCRVLKYVGYDQVLQSPQSLTVWAPALTHEQADSVIDLYDQQKKSIITMPDGTVRSVQDKDNKAITQFVQNHIALYGRSVATSGTDTIQMMNGKKKILTANTIQDVPFASKNIVASNGILYTLATPITFLPNVREALGTLQAPLDSVYNFFEHFDNYSLDESSSVQRSIVDGKIVYADSVLTLNNTLYNTLGWIAREDSNYLFIAPTNEVWKSEYEAYLPYFNYVDAMEHRDSVARLNAQMAIVRGRFFNRNTQKNDGQDSLMNTMYVASNNYYGLNVFAQPNTTILAGLTPNECSNGIVMVDPDGRIDPRSTFLEDRYLLASNPQGRKSPLLLVNNEKVEAVSVETRAIIDSVRYTIDDQEQLFRFEELKDKNYIEITPQTFTGVTNRNGSIYFYLPYTFSGLYYNVYLITVPAYACEDGYTDDEVLPTRFQVYYNERLQTPRTSLTTDPNDDADYAAPNQDRALTVPEGETHSSGNQYFLTSGNQVDVICIDKARLATFSAYNIFGTSSPVMRYRITTNVRQTDLNKGVQTNVMRINRLIYVGFKTAEEAKAYQLDLSNIKEYNVAL